MMAEEQGEEGEEKKTLPTRFEGRRAELNGCWPRSVYIEERCNCSRKIFFVLDYTFARHRGGPAIEERERYRRTACVATVVVGPSEPGTREGKHLRK